MIRSFVSLSGLYFTKQTLKHTGQRLTAITAKKRRLQLVVYNLDQIRRTELQYRATARVFQVQISIPCLHQYQVIRWDFNTPQQIYYRINFLTTSCQYKCLVTNQYVQAYHQ